MELRKKMITMLTYLLFVLLFITIIGCTQTTPEPAQAVPAATQPATGNGQSTAPDGEALINTNCSICHSPNIVFNANKSADDWMNTIDRMIAKGAPDMTTEEKNAIVQYLTAQ